MNQYYSTMLEKGLLPNYVTFHLRMTFTANAVGNTLSDVVQIFREMLQHQCKVSHRTYYILLRAWASFSGNVTPSPQSLETPPEISEKSVELEPSVVQADAAQTLEEQRLAVGDPQKLSFSKFVDLIGSVHRDAGIAFRQNHMNVACQMLQHGNNDSNVEQRSIGTEGTETDHTEILEK